MILVMWSRVVITLCTTVFGSLAYEAECVLRRTCPQLQICICHLHQWFVSLYHKSRFNQIEPRAPK